MASQLLGLGFRGYVSDGFNIFDGFIVGTNVLVLVVTVAQGEDVFEPKCETGINPSLFRTLRLVRLLHTVPSASLHALLGIIASVLDDTFALCLIFLLFLYTCTLIGMVYLGDKLDRCQGV